MRIGEVLVLERGDLDFKNNLIKVRKTLSRDKERKFNRSRENQDI